MRQKKLRLPPHLVRLDRDRRFVADYDRRIQLVTYSTALMGVMRNCRNESTTLAALRRGPCSEV